jgi:hypothetical protein
MCKHVQLVSIASQPMSMAASEKHLEEQGGRLLSISLAAVAVTAYTMRIMRYFILTQSEAGVIYVATGVGNKDKMSGV